MFLRNTLPTYYGSVKYPDEGLKINLNYFVPLVPVMGVRNECTEPLSAEPAMITVQSEDDVPVKYTDLSCDDLPRPVAVGELLKICFLSTNERIIYLQSFC